MPDDQYKHRVVIVGGHFASLGCAQKLADHDDVQRTLIDRNNYHQFQPLLHRAIATTIRTATAPPTARVHTAGSYRAGIPPRLVLTPRHGPARSVAASDDVCNAQWPPAGSRGRTRPSLPARTASIYQAPQVKPERHDTVAVMVVDDQSPFRRAARAVINATTGFEAVGDAESGPEALRYADKVQPDLVLIDVHMPGMDGFETTRRLTESHRGCVVVLVSLNALELPASAVTGCGAVAFVRKEELRPETLRSLWSRHGPRD